MTFKNKLIHMIHNSIVTTLLKEEDVSIINMINKFGYDKTVVDDIEGYDLIMFPENYSGKTGYDIDLINIAKILRTNGYLIKVVDPEVDIIEKNDADIIINLGLIISNFVPIIVLIIQFLEKKYSNTSDKKSPRIHLEYYVRKKGKEKKIIFDGNIEDLSRAIGDLKGKNND